MKKPILLLGLATLLAACSDDKTVELAVANPAGGASLSQLAAVPAAPILERLGADYVYVADASGREIPSQITYDGLPMSQPARRASTLSAHPIPAVYTLVLPPDASTPSGPMISHGKTKLSVSASTAPPPRQRENGLSATIYSSNIAPTTPYSRYSIKMRPIRLSGPVSILSEPSTPNLHKTTSTVSPTISTMDWVWTATPLARP